MAATAVAAATKSTRMGTPAEATSCVPSAPEGVRRTATCIGMAAARVTACATTIGRTSAVSASSAVAVTASKPVAATESVSAPVSVTAPSVTPTPSVPGAYAEEDAAGEPLRPVIAVGCTAIRIVRVITPLAGGRTVVHRGLNDCRANPNSHRNLSLC